jgi:hypothetical protein
MLFLDEAMLISAYGRLPDPPNTTGATTKDKWPRYMLPIR